MADLDLEQTQSHQETIWSLERGGVDSRIRQENGLAKLVGRRGRHEPERLLSGFAALIPALGARPRVTAIGERTDLASRDFDRWPNAEGLAKAAVEIGRQSMIDPGHVVLNYAHSMGPSFFPVGQAALKFLDRHGDAVATVRARMAANLDWSRLPEDSSEFLDACAHLPGANRGTRIHRSVRICEAVRDRVVPACDCDTVLRAAFGSGLTATEENVRHSLTAYTDHLRQETGPLLIVG